MRHMILLLPILNLRFCPPYLTRSPFPTRLTYLQVLPLTWIRILLVILRTYFRPILTPRRKYLDRNKGMDKTSRSVLTTERLENGKEVKIIFLQKGSMQHRFYFFAFLRRVWASARRVRSAKHARWRKDQKKWSPFFCAFPRSACLVLLARIAHAFARLKNPKNNAFSAGQVKEKTKRCKKERGYPSIKFHVSTTPCKVLLCLRGLFLY